MYRCLFTDAKGATRKGRKIQRKIVLFRIEFSGTNAYKLHASCTPGGENGYFSLKTKLGFGPFAPHFVDYNKTVLKPTCTHFYPLVVKPNKILFSKSSTKHKLINSN